MNAQKYQVIETTLAKSGAVVTSQPVGRIYDDKVKAESFAARCSFSTDAPRRYQVLAIK
jgi:hypothetical protein